MPLMPSSLMPHAAPRIDMSSITLGAAHAHQLDVITSPVNKMPFPAPRLMFRHYIPCHTMKIDNVSATVFVDAVPAHRVLAVVDWLADDYMTFTFTLEIFSALRPSFSFFQKSCRPRQATRSPSAHD